MGKGTGKERVRTRSVAPVQRCEDSKPDNALQIFLSIIAPCTETTHRKKKKDWLQKVKKYMHSYMREKHSYLNTETKASEERKITFL